MKLEKTFSYECCIFNTCSKEKNFNTKHITHYNE